MKRLFYSSSSLPKRRSDPVYDEVCSPPRHLDDHRTSLRQRLSDPIYDVPVSHRGTVHSQTCHVGPLSFKTNCQVRSYMMLQNSPKNLFISFSSEISLHCPLSASEFSDCLGGCSTITLFIDFCIFDLQFKSASGIRVELLEKGFTLS